MNVHHRSYRKGADPWEYADDELVVLCETCHLARHQLEAEVQHGLSYLGMAELYRVIGYVNALAIVVRANSVSIDVGNVMCRLGVLDAVSGNAEGWMLLEQTLKDDGKWLPPEEVINVAGLLSRCVLDTRAIWPPEDSQ